MPLPNRSHVLVPLQNRTAFVEQSFERGNVLGMFIPGELDVALGDVLDVELWFVEDQVRFHARASVKWKRNDAGRRALPAGIGVELLAGEARTREALRTFVSGALAAHVERARRYALQIDVKVKHDGQVLTGLTDDVSESGCFFVTDVALPVGTMVEMRMRAVRALFGWITLRAHITWARDEAPRGVGLRFDFDTDAQRRRMRRIVEHQKQRMFRELQIRMPRTSLVPTSS